MSPFKKAINEAMLMLAADPRSIFVGQSVRYDGAAVYDSLDGVPMGQRIEMPVVEDFQLGFCTGLALMGKIPICIYPRMDFMLLCANQLINHLDKLPLFGWNPKVIIRTTVGALKPLNAGPQHTQDHTFAFQMMLKTIPVYRVTNDDQVRRAYARAQFVPYSTLIVENP
jgi:pyruvate/2-oxoglutarate/acetoin dehydrogenase E1 component